MAEYAAGPKAYADGIRAYAPNVFSGGAGAPAATSMAPHLSQPNPLGEDLVSAYRQFLTDPQAKQYEQYGADVDRLWKTSPTASIFKPGYAHNPYVLERADQLRQLRATPPAEGADTSAYMMDPETGQMVRNPLYRDPNREGSSD